jgi:peptidoglycan biosynthesis protein MviN/MurJ (putative lipid II flippase)
VSVAFIPTFRRYLERADARETREFLSATFTVLSFATTATVVLGIAATPLIVPLFGTATGETVLLTRIMFPYLAIISIAAFLQGILNGMKIFSPSGFTPILFNCFVIGLTYLLAPSPATRRARWRSASSPAASPRPYSSYPSSSASGFASRSPRSRGPFATPVPAQSFA